MGATVKARSSKEVFDRRQYAAEREIFHEGDAAHCAWFIESGRVLIVKQGASGPIKLGILGPGEIFGELALIDNTTRMASAITLEPVVLVPIARRYLERRLEKADPFIARLIGILVNNVRSITDRHVAVIDSQSPITEAEANRVVEAVLGKPGEATPG